MPEGRTPGKARFMAVYGGVFEHSPWIAGQVWDDGLHDAGVPELHAAFSAVIRGADRARQLELLRAHPQLACAMASGDELTAESRGEQQGAGLDQCNEAELEEFEYLNGAYTNKFGFPFILAVKQLGRVQILQIFRTRLANSPQQEFREALEQVIRIGKYRLLDAAAKQEVKHDG